MSLLTDEQKERMRKATALRVLKDMSPSEIDETLQSLKDKLDAVEQELQDSKDAMEQIKELEQDIESYKKAFIEMEGNADMARKLQPKLNLEQRAKGIIEAATDLASPYGAIPVDALHEYARQLKIKAEEL